MSEYHVHDWVVEATIYGTAYEYCIAPDCGAGYDLEFDNEEDA